MARPRGKFSPAVHRWTTNSTVMTDVERDVGLSRPPGTTTQRERLSTDPVRGGERAHELTRRDLRPATRACDSRGRACRTTWWTWSGSPQNVAVRERSVSRRGCRTHDVRCSTMRQLHRQFDPTCYGSECIIPLQLYDRESQSSLIWRRGAPKRRFTDGASAAHDDARSCAQIHTRPGSSSAHASA